MSIHAAAEGDAKWPKAGLPGKVHPRRASPYGCECQHKFGGHNCGQDSTLQEPSIIAQPEDGLSPTEPDINASVE